jgi:hypothetical protein
MTCALIHATTGLFFGAGRLRLDVGEDPPDQPRGDRPACAGEEANAEPDADLVEVDGGGHVGFSLLRLIAKR